VLVRELKVMDATAVSLCMDNDLPIVVFDLMGEGNVPAGRPGREDRHAGQPVRPLMTGMACLRGLAPMEDAGARRRAPGLWTDPQEPQ